MVVILKDTALGAIITFPETLNTFSQIGSYKSNPVPALIVIALIFIAINYVLTSLASRVEASLRDKGRATIAKGTIGPPNALDLKPVEEALILADEKVLQKRYHSEGQ